MAFLRRILPRSNLHRRWRKTFFVVCVVLCARQHLTIDPRYDIIISNSLSECVLFIFLRTWKEEEEEVILIMHRLNIWNKTPGGRKPRLYPHRFLFLSSGCCFRFSIIIITWRPVYTEKEREKKYTSSKCVCVYVARLWGGNEALLLCTRWLVVHTHKTTWWNGNNSRQPQRLQHEQVSWTEMWLFFSKKENGEKKQFEKWSARDFCEVEKK